jgi:hypothetical protein
MLSSTDAYSTDLQETFYNYEVCDGTLLANTANTTIIATKLRRASL